MGRRQTFFDGLGTIIFNRDRDLMDIVVRVAVYLVLNITWAMFFMFWVFIFGLPRLIWTFGASWVRHHACLSLYCVLVFALVLVTPPGCATLPSLAHLLHVCPCNTACTFRTLLCKAGSELHSLLKLNDSSSTGTRGPSNTSLLP